MLDTKRVTIKLWAYTRVDYEEVWTVPASMGDAELDELTERVSDNTDGGDFSEDPDYWDEHSTHEHCGPANFATFPSHLRKIHDAVKP